MAILPYSKIPDNPLNFKNFKRNPKKQNLKKLEKLEPNPKSIWAILASTFMYISILFIFNLSPATLICTTKFWFFISNTLVLILAADFAAFSSTKKLDFHEVYTIKDTITTSSENNPVVSTYREHVIKDIDATSSEGDVIDSKEMMTWHDTREEEEEDCITNAIVEGNHEKKKMKRAKCMRSNAGSSAVVAAAEEERAVVLRRTSSERYDQYCGKQGMEDERNDEFSRMSNEELNTRFEEFIRRFNRQIRLQAVRRNRQNFEKN